MSTYTQKQHLMRSAFTSFSTQLSTEVPHSYFTTYYGPMSDMHMERNAKLNHSIGGEDAAETFRYTGNTVIHAAAVVGDMSKIAMLLKLGMLVASRNHRDETPSFCAAVNGNISAAALLQRCSRH
jgi:ankyrin repeat protein